MKMLTRLEKLNTAVSQWLDYPKASQQSITVDIINAVEQAGMTDSLKSAGIIFTLTGDIFRDARINAQKIFRWLGRYEEQAVFYERVFEFETALLLVMPETIRIDYLDSVYGDVGIFVCNRPTVDGQLVGKDLAASLLQETSEASVAVVQLASGAAADSPERAKVVKRELREAISMAVLVLDATNKQFPSVINLTRPASTPLTH